VVGDFVPVVEVLEVEVVDGVEEVVVGVVEAGAGVQDSETAVTGNLTGSGIEDNGVPGGTLTVNDSV
jgi:hypothetical protein